MKANTLLTRVGSALALTVANGSLAHAATNQRVYSSGLLVLVFIGFVALVVVIQMIPAILTLIGMLKGLATKKKDETAVENN